MNADELATRTLWYQFVHRPTYRWAFQWDGSMTQVRGHFTPVQIDKFCIRVMKDTNGPVLTARTEVTTMFVYPGDWIVLSYWGDLKRWELYCNKAPILASEYDPTGETLDMHECNIINGAVQ